MLLRIIDISLVPFSHVRSDAESLKFSGSIAIKFFDFAWGLRCAIILWCFYGDERCMQQSDLLLYFQQVFYDAGTASSPKKHDMCEQNII